MTNKSKRFPTKKLRQTRGLVAFARGLLSLAPYSENMGRFCGSLLDSDLGTLDDLEPVSDPSNSDTPSSKQIGGAAKRRRKGKRKPGGQKGHTYELVPDPDEVVDVTPQGLKNHPDYELVGEVKRQRVDTVSKRHVTEYRSLVYRNVRTGEKVCGKFPPGFEAPFHVGDGLMSLIVYLRDYQHIPYGRLRQHLHDVYGVDLSEAALVSVVREVEHSIVLIMFQTTAMCGPGRSPQLLRR